MGSLCNFSQIIVICVVNRRVLVTVGAILISRMLGDLPNICRIKGQSELSFIIQNSSKGFDELMANALWRALGNIQLLSAPVLYLPHACTHFTNESPVVSDLPSLELLEKWVLWSNRCSVFENPQFPLFWSCGPIISSKTVNSIPKYTCWLEKVFEQPNVICLIWINQERFVQRHTNRANRDWPSIIRPNHILLPQVKLI